ncbi:MAG: MBL fold metallo-hydrolase [Culturomica sp.]|nr:MBL fold metallo-hydrolase [Culturomica sp.]
MISFEESNTAWCIDPGDSRPILDWLADNHKVLCGILVTHAHFDHIYGINDLTNQFPEATIYVSEYGKECLQNAKLNGSLYHEMPFVVRHNKIEVVNENVSIEMSDNQVMQVWETPGHSRDSLTFYIEEQVFTGDAFIPGIKTRTVFKGGDKEQAARSIQKILSRINDSTVIYPGHKEICYKKECEIV